MILALLTAWWTIGPLTIDSDPQEWAELAMKLEAGSCVAHILPQDVCVENPDELHGYQTHRIKVCRDGATGWGIVEVTPFYLRGTGAKIVYKSWHS
jgi:hypothetical protein